MRLSSDLYARLVERVFHSFWNEYLIKANCYRRRGVPLSKSNAWFSILAFGPEHRMKHRYRTLRWLVATLCNCVFLLIAPRTHAGQSISLITHPRHLSFIEPERPAFRVGLHNFRFFKYPHLLSTLTFREMCRGFWQARVSLGQALNACRRECAQRDVDFAVFRRLCNLGFFRYADYVLSYMALERLGRVEVATTVQFDAYLAWLSTYRDVGLGISLVGFQHGLFELPPPPHQYEPIGFDAYYLRYRESKRWFADNLSDNPNCEIEHHPRPSTIEWQTIDRAEFDKVLAYAAQESVPGDVKVIDTLLSYAEAANALVVLYLHPNYQGFPLERWNGSGSFRVFSRERHENIDLLVTRFSSMAMDYRLALGTKILFVPGTDSLCIFEHEDITVCRDVNELASLLPALLDP